MAELVVKPCKCCGRNYTGEHDFLTGTSGWRICTSQALWFECSCGSTLMVPKGKYQWYAPDKFMSADAASLFNRLPAIKTLPHVADHVTKIQQLARDPAVGVPDLARAIRRDPVLAASILAIASNIKAARSDRSPVESLEHSIVFLGRKYVSDFVLMTSVQTFDFKTRHFKAESFWQRSFLTGAVAEALGAKLDQGALKDELYISGTLCNLGKLVGAMCTPDQIDAIELAMKNPRGVAVWTELEKRLSLHPHTTLGEIAAVLWGLPKYVAHSCANHHMLPDARLPTEVKDRVRPRLIALANQLVHWILLEPERIDPVVLNGAAEFFHLKDSDLERLSAELMPLKVKMADPAQAVAS